MRYVIGDVTELHGDGKKILAHVCNDVGGWGSGVVVAISRKWREPELAYRKWVKTDNFSLGEVQFVAPNSDLLVANMVAQHGYAVYGKPAIDYNSLKKCLTKVASKAQQIGATIHMPRIGCGLAGGSWDEVEPIILETMGNLDVTIYDLE